MLKRKCSYLLVLAFVLVIIAFIGLENGYIKAQTDNIYMKIKVIGEILNAVRNNYVEKVDSNKLLEKAINGMLEGLDPHTVYVPPERFTRMRDNFAGYGGIGISFLIVRNKITVMSVMEHGPSKKVGIEPGDRIIKINGESAIGIKIEDVPKKLKGIPGTKVTVTIEREGWDKPRDFVITRAHVDVESVQTAYMIGDDIGYIKLNKFSSTTAEELEKALNKLEKQGMKKLLFDLRNNTGGYLNEAVAVADKFLSGNKKIVYTRGRIRSSNREEYSTDAATHEKFPLIILINRNTASASEIVSGAVQDWDRGLIVGETSFGKGLVQTQIKLSNGGALLLTTAKYFTPSGRLIQRPYKNKTREQYRREAYNDSLRNALILKEKRPMFKTNGGRVVYGGGGITPDVFIPASNDTVSFFLRNLLSSNDIPIQTYADKYAAKYKNLWIDADTFIKEFKLIDRILNEFKETLNEINYKFDEKTLQTYREELEFWLKSEIAYQLWGNYGKQKVFNADDIQLKKSLKLFDKAKELMIKYGYK
ncbi:S41 family peptidase [candidate division KSB1 bacterium]|nr:MAG: S41 family peptidase [candidate division KSB1 bacterium]